MTCRPGCNWKRGGNSLPTHISLCRARGLQGWAVRRQQQIKNCSAKDVLLNRTLTCHKHDLSLEFVTGSSFGAGKDFSSREQDLPQQRWQKILWVTPCPDTEGVPEEGEIGAASPCGVGDPHSSFCLKKGVISFTKEGAFIILGMIMEQKYYQRLQQWR